MIEGVLRHCTEMSIDKQYVDSHGQSEVGFAFCRLLHFQLLPRLKGIRRQKLYTFEAGAAERFPNLGLINSLREAAPTRFALSAIRSYGGIRDRTPDRNCAEVVAIHPPGDP